MQPKELKQNFKVLEFNYPELFNKAMTFKQYNQEYTARNKDNPLKQGINENLIELGSDLFDFYFHDFFTFQDLPNKDQNTFTSYSDIRTQKQQLLTEKNLAEVAIQLGLKEKMLVSINQNSDLKNNQKIQSQSLKALIGAQYFDKQKDLNLLRKLMQPIFKDLIKKSLEKTINVQNESLNLVKQENFKGEFIDFMDKHPEYTYKLVFQESLNLFDKNRKIYQYELLINDVLPLKSTGEQKKAVEAQVFKDALQLLKTDEFLQLLDDSMKNQQEIIQQSGISESQVQSHIHNNLKFVQQLGQIEESLKQKEQINEQEELGRLVESYLQKF
ncbi:unnamed protein product (macronuclear) [Paramecium tetraurelia]|uniref:RNase III domain-containing protein n=1 Tax=Paramecium tetraurelia TaxID=5888 RepID=A0DL06_PARTE|nr:uncharacterized protein GSPATT00018040001 [Paramecium tetraurelia]CAK83723.1 unnamed protein product [Paramecium tetraurelia]|eukprot:XP_001451120.1 hypothetical protein (macronuclear) [Paramecium tetraurelia strain d4-2]